MDTYIWSNPKYTNLESIPVKYTFNPGVTMLIGPNGSGKTTTLHQLNSIFNHMDFGVQKWNNIEQNNKVSPLYNCFHYENKYEERFTKDSWLNGEGSIRDLAESFGNSEGQDILNFLNKKVPKIGSTVTKSKKANYKGIFILIDGLDSGLSLDIINYLRTSLLDFIISIDNTEDFEVYIICSANSYEFCNNYDCVDVTTQQHIKFTNYEEYAKYFETNYINNKELK